MLTPLICFPANKELGEVGHYYHPCAITSGNRFPIAPWAKALTATGAKASCRSGENAGGAGYELVRLFTMHFTPVWLICG